MQTEFQHAVSKPTTCGPASLAIIARTSVKHAKAAIFGPAYKGPTASYWHNIRDGLAALGVPTGERASWFRNWLTLKAVSIVACGKQKNGDWHWVVYDGDRQLVYDPLKPAPVPVRRFRMKPIAYLQVMPRG